MDRDSTILPVMNKAHQTLVKWMHKSGTQEKGMKGMKTSKITGGEVCEVRRESRLKTWKSPTFRVWAEKAKSRADKSDKPKGS